MPVNLSIKGVPDDIAEALREMAAKNQRSLQGQLMVIIQEAVAAGRARTPKELLSKVRSLGLSTPREALSMIREDRDAH